MIRRTISLFFEALRATWAAKTRAFLSAICIGLGIAGITLIAALGSAAIAKGAELMDLFGTDSMMVFSGGKKKMAAGARSMTLSADDVSGLRANFPDAYLVAPLRINPALLVSYQNSSLTSRVEAVSIGMEYEWDWDVEIGRDLTPQDSEFSSNVCVIGSYINETFFQGDDPIGKQITVGKGVCEVVGVAQKKSLGLGDDSGNTFVMIPDSVFVKKYAWRKNFMMGLRMRFGDPEQVEAQTESVREFLRYRHNLAEGEEDDFRILTSSMISGMFVAVMGAIGAFLVIITSVVVVVGGFVTANMFLLATQTRIKEIGIRRAFGASGKDIFTQFILEFIVITLLGMLLGLAIGWVASAAISSFGFVEVRITPAVFAVTAFMSMVIALAFGILPARSAAKVSPIEAIRSL
ncbi:MAG: ABC transporter permease [Deferribacteraceae bacterium]|jgi:putative ABC transport system permease protein|nr:ABC transporter permease [Deferribacteraceae bacterium]